MTQIHCFHLQADSESQMASTDDSDDSSEDEPQYSAIIQPPLIKQLRKILDEYPDGGQILKVCEYSPNLSVNDSSWTVLIKFIKQFYKWLNSLICWTSWHYQILIWLFSQVWISNLKKKTLYVIRGIPYQYILVPTAQ